MLNLLMFCHKMGDELDNELETDVKQESPYLLF